MEIHHTLTLDHEQKLQLAKIYAECFRGAPWFENWTVESALATIDDYRSSYEGRQSVFFLATENGTVCALAIAVVRDFLGLRPAHLWIAEVATDSRYQGQGLATRVVSAVLQEAQRRGFNTIRSRTRFDNLAMIRVFEKSGFWEISRDVVETGGKSSERIIFERKV